MAEAIELVAGSLEISKTVLKLRSLCNEVKEAPATVSDLLEEVELIGKILSGAQNIRSAANSPPTLCNDAHVSPSWWT
ncbi:MAG: hypothetical protein M1820_008678 [Bogoriella megaspora]|nr:MAG: hypothetical protein M1820_008678 [Bogoriella megaspora]